MTHRVIIIKDKRNIRLVQGVEYMDDVKIKVTDSGGRAEEPVEEFQGNFASTTRSLGGGVVSLAGQVARLGFGVATLPLNLLPARSRYHAKNAVKEGFLTVKVLVDDVADFVDETLTRSMERDKTRASMDDLDGDIPTTR
jgi:hypothetical protein